MGEAVLVDGGQGGFLAFPEERGLLVGAQLDLLPSVGRHDQWPSALRRSSPWDFHHWCRIVMSVPTEKCRTPMSRKYFA